MVDDEYRFYRDYEPVTNVSKFLNEPEEDYDLSAPYRDLLGILESEQIWLDENSITAEEILEKLTEWDNTERERYESPPKDTKTVRNQLRDLHNDRIIKKIDNPGKASRYWKVPDEEISHPVWLKTSKYGREIASLLRETLCCHDLTLIAVSVYIVGSLVDRIHPLGSNIMIAAFVLFLIGHFMAYQDIPLFS